MEQNRQKNGLLNSVLLVGLSAMTYAVSRYAQSLAGQVVTVFLGLGTLTSLVSWFQLGLEERERAEQLEMTDLTRSGTDARLFNQTESETLIARRTREHFERDFIPGFCLVLFVAEVAAVSWLWRWLDRAASGIEFQRTLIAMALLGLFALFLFITGKFSASLARLENSRLHQPVSSWMLLGSYLLGLTVAGLAAVDAGFSQVDTWFARGLVLLIALISLENALTLLLELYRPRVKGKVERLLYESRLVDLLSHPEDIFTTAAHVLDYQFGFKVSETWFYQFLRRSLGWLVLAQLGILFVSTCFVFVETGEQALLERFGRPVGDGVIEPGFHLKLPWPFESIYRFRTQAIQTFHIGFDDGDEHESTGGESTILWTVGHVKDEFNLIVASQDTSTNSVAGKKAPPVNLLAIGIPVQYQINDLKKWAYNHKNAGELLEKIGTREVVRYLVSVDLEELISTARFKAAEELRNRIQARADELGLGVKILFLGLQDAHPPVRVAKAYEAVVGARQKREANLLAAQAHQVRTNAQAAIGAQKREREAEATRARIISESQARAALFTNQFAAYSASPSVYAQRAYLQTLSQGSVNARKYILATTNTHDILQYNLEEKLRDGTIDIPIPSGVPAPGKAK